MQNLLKDLEELLKNDERFVADGKLLKNKIIEEALKLDSALLKLLLTHKAIKKHFFQDVEKMLVFDKIKFQKFVSNKQFLPDSYTAFKNKIGLTSPEGEYLSECKEVVLSWPYKDCVLEGGQTKEDAKRNEVFWNEILAPDEIDRLFEPKVLTNFKRYDKDGEHAFTGSEKIDFDKENMIIKGNNLLALHSLKKRFAGQVKLIYIDPPYNTGSDSFGYNDSFNHSTWLTFMKNRLEAAWELLSDEGCIFIQTDDSEFAYLKILCDETLGRENFKENIILKSSTESGVNAVNVKRGERLFKVKENILFYSKKPSFRFKPFFTKAEYNMNYKYEVIKGTKGFTVTDLKKKFFDKCGNTEQEKIVCQYNFIEYCLNNADNIYSLEKNIKKAGDKFKKFAEDNKSKNIVEEYTNSFNERVLVYDGGSFVPLKERIVEEDGKKYFGVLASDLWVDIGTTPSGEGGVSFSNGKKSEKLLKRIIEMTTEDDDIVLDYHLGSGSTAAVAHKLKRRYIGIEQLDYGDDDSIVRLCNVINGDQSGISRIVNWKGGGNFIFCELFKVNLSIIEKIEMLKEKDIPLFIDGLEKNILLSFTYNHSFFKTEDFKKLDIREKKKVLKDMFDINHLYLNYCDMGDSDFTVNTSIKKINKIFYKE